MRLAPIAAPDVAPGALEKLWEAQRRAVKAIERWHFDGEKDLTLFEGFSLGKIYRGHLVEGATRLFRKAALGASPGAPNFWEDSFDKKYHLQKKGIDFPIRRDGWKASAFRAAAKFLELLNHKRQDGLSVLMAGGTPNLTLWSYWIENAEESRDVYLDFPLTQAPPPRLALRSLWRKSRIFDPPIVALTTAQESKIRDMRSVLLGLFKTTEWRALFFLGGGDLSECFIGKELMFFLESLEALALKCLAYERELQKLSPDLILIGEEQTVDVGILYSLAVKRAARVFFLSHGFPGGYRFKDYPICGDLEAERIFAWGDGDKKNCELAGVSAERISITGNPTWDLYLKDSVSRPFRRVAGSTILVLHHGTAAGAHTVYRDESQERYFAEVPRLLDKMGAREILFKFPQPGPRLSYYREKMRKSRLGKCSVQFLQYEKFSDVLDKADFVIGPVSTAIFETLCSGKDYFLVNYDPLSSPPPFELHRDYVAKSIQELERNLREGRCVPREEILRDFCDIRGGEGPWHFSRRVMDEIRRAA